MGENINITVDDEDMGDISITVDPETAEPPLSIPVDPEYIQGRDGITFEPHVNKDGQVTTLLFTNNGNRPNPPPAEILDGKDGAGQTVLIGTEADPITILGIVVSGDYVLKGNILDLPNGIEPRPGESVTLYVRTTDNLIAYELMYGGCVVFGERRLS